jgi:cytoskeletal protein CcmA (bactofilin family)
MAENECVIGEDIEIRGNVSGSGDLVVCGRIEGEVHLADALTVQEGGVVVANVQTGKVVVHGDLHGDIAATNSVTISETGDIEGNIRAPKIEIADGGRFRGRLEMDFELPEGILN